LYKNKLVNVILLRIHTPLFTTKTKWRQVATKKYMLTIVQSFNI